ncbi:formin-like protein 18 [Phoenix dactylifera]|uniref:Formin-like protein 18 n=1 Tax=Phoenix dactylifera TaxID=42345 RepID=A0A8B7CGW3_PHODC|nr:formin-like protein 18 [Phoenix dactylifera]XP_008798761.1 formin-like protein 18 [Phoenix dactylifera]
MVSDQEIASCVESLLRQSDPATAVGANLSSVVRQVEAKLGLDLSHKAGFIRDQIELLLGPPRPPPPPPPNQQRHLLYPLQQGHTPPVSSPFPHQPGLDFQYPPPLPAAAVVAAYHLQQQLQQPPRAAPTTVRPAAMPAPKESASTGVKRRGGPGGLNKLCGVSPELQAIVGEATMPRTEIVRQLWAYIRKNNLQDPNNRRKIICNDELRLVFETDCTDMFKMNKLLAKHIIPLETTKAAEPDSKKLKTEDVVAATEPDAGQYPVVISDALFKFFGSEEKEMPEIEAFRRVWDYIKSNQLEDSENTLIVCDPKLQELFGCESLPTSGLSEMLASHVVKRS